MGKADTTNRLEVDEAEAGGLGGAKAYDDAIENIIIYGS